MYPIWIMQAAMIHAGAENRIIRYELCSDDYTRCQKRKTNGREYSDVYKDCYAWLAGEANFIGEWGGLITSSVEGNQRGQKSARFVEVQNKGTEQEKMRIHRCCLVKKSEEAKDEEVCPPMIPYSTDLGRKRRSL